MDTLVGDGIVVFYPGQDGLHRIHFQGEQAMWGAAMMFSVSHAHVRPCDVLVFSCSRRNDTRYLECPEKSDLTIQLRGMIQAARDNPELALRHLSSGVE